MDVVKDLDCQYVEEHDLVTSYLSGRLSEDDAEAFEKHYFGCERCWAEVKAGEEIRATLKGGAAVAAPPSNVRRGPWQNWKLLAVAAAVGIAAAGTVLLLSTRQSQDVPRQLAVALGDRLPFEVRLTGPFSSLAPGTPVRGGEVAENTKLQYWAAKAALDSERDRSVENLHTSGLANLVTSKLDQSKLDQAVKDLNEASENKPDDTTLLVDLSAARLVRGRVRKDDADFRAAYEAAERALVWRPDLPEALFNKALALEGVEPDNTEAIAAAWKKYLDRDRSSPWSRVARVHLDAASRKKTIGLWEHEKPKLNATGAGAAQTVGRIAAEFPQDSRLYVEEELLPQWANAAARSDASEATESLRIAREIASSLFAQTGDALLRDAIATIDHAFSESSRDDLRASLIAGHQRYGMARQLYKNGEMARAAGAFRASREALSGARSPFRAKAALEVGTCQFNQNAFDDSLKQAERLREEERANESRYISLFARLDWLIGLLQLGTGHPYEALHAYQSALNRFERLSETENIAALHTLVSECFEYLGQTRDAWTHRQRALTLSNSQDLSFWRSQALSEAAKAALAEGMPEIALLYLNEGLDLAVRLANPPLAADALRWRSVAHERRGDPRRARLDLEQAFVWSRSIPDAFVRERTEADLSEALTTATAKTSPEEALAALSTSLDFFLRSGNHFRVARAYLERGDILLATGREEEAQADLEAGIRELETQRERLPNESLRVSYFETARGLFDREIGLLSKRGKAVEALDMAERARARSLLDAMEHGSRDSAAAYAKTVPAARAASAFPDTLSLVEYRVLPERLCIWTVAEGRVELRTVAISAELLNQRVRAFLLSLRNTTSDFEIASVRLSEILLSPVADRLTPGAPVVFVPDGALGEIPFAALRDPGGRGFLIERHALSVTPSLSVFLANAARIDADDRAVALSALVVGDPTFDLRLYPELSELRGAEREAQSVGQIYPHSEVLIGNQATRGRFLESATRHSVLHFAGHALVSRDRPALSALVLTSDAPGGSGLLYAHEISGARLSNTRLAVLAGCQTGAGSTTNGEGTQSLAAAFLRAGVSEVVASLWDVPDTVAAAFGVRFHESFQRCRVASAALRDTQLALMRSSDPALRPPASWAAFELIGSSTSQ